MEEKKIVIVGGGVAAKGFLSVMINLYKNVSITVVNDTDEQLIPCGIPYVFGTLPSAEADISPKDSLVKAGVHFKQGKVSKLDRAKQTVYLENGESIYYDKLILATGAEPVILPIPGHDLDGIFTIQKDFDEISSLREEINKAEKIAVIGGGFIGVEISDEIAKLGKEVNLFETYNCCLWQAFDPEFSEIAEQKLTEKGVHLYTGHKVKEFRGENNKLKEVILEDDTHIPASLAIFAVGVRPRGALAKESGLPLALDGCIMIDHYMYTKDPNVLAIGDCASKIDFFDGGLSQIKLASVAATEGKLAALNIFQKTTPRKNPGVISLFATSVGNIRFGAAGLTEQQAKQRNINYIISGFQTADRHPTVMPGMTTTIGKAVFSAPEGKLLGVQLRGGPSIAELTNLFGLAIQYGLTAFDLLALQYGSHPMLTAGPTLHPAFTLAQNALKELQSSDARITAGIA